MELSPEINQQAAEFGKRLAESEIVQNYIGAQNQFKTDSSAQDLFVSFTKMHQELTIKQRNQQHISDQELNKYNQLRFQLQTHPVIADKDAALTEVRELFVKLGVEISMQLGLDFPNMATRYQIQK